MQDLPYRPNVGIVLFNHQGLTLVGERLDNKGSWQYPQGGVDAGEDEDAAACRELHEEVGITLVLENSRRIVSRSHERPEPTAEIVYRLPELLDYDFAPTLHVPGLTDRYRGQRQRWYLAYWDHGTRDADLRTHTQEFGRVAFLPMDEVARQIVSFKKAIYAKLAEEFAPRIDAFLQPLREMT